jgi:hypothetical protein
MLKLTRVLADEHGHTYFADVVLPSLADAGDGVGGRRLALREIPTTTLNINEMVDRISTVDFHVAPRRQMIVVLRGAFEITTSRGERKRFEPGDCLLAEDVEGEGHRFDDVGDDLLATLAIGFADSWEVPGA